MTNYSTNVSDSQWQVIKEYLYRKRKPDLREKVNAVLYVVKTGCQWRMLPGNFPGWQLVYYYCRKWIEAEVFDRILDKLRSKVRASKEQQSRATLGIIQMHSAFPYDLSHFTKYPY